MIIKNKVYYCQLLAALAIVILTILQFKVNQRAFQVVLTGKLKHNTSQIHTFVYVDNDKRGHRMLCELAASHGQFSEYPLYVLGWNGSSQFADGNEFSDVPRHIGHRNRAYMKKSKWLAYLANHGSAVFGISSQDLILVIDSDVLFQDDIEKIRTIYENRMGHKRGLLFNGEKTCFPFGHGQARDFRRYRKYYPSGQSFYGKNACRNMRMFSNGPFPHLNFGSFISDMASLVNFYKAIDLLREEDGEAFAEYDDQALAQRVMLQFSKHQVPIVVDDLGEFSYLWVNGQHFRPNATKPDRVKPNTERMCNKNAYLDSQGQPPVHLATNKSSVMLHFASARGRQCMDSCYRSIMKNRVVPSNAYIIDADRNQKIYLSGLCNNVLDHPGYVDTWNEGG